DDSDLLADERDGEAEGGVTAVRRWFFFFSSRRRHTRWPRDWSSDVCSSDLSPSSSAWCWSTRFRLRTSSEMNSPVPMKPTELNRSEERRVGKECRSRWWA